MSRLAVIFLLILQSAGYSTFAHQPAEGKIHALVGPLIQHAVPYHHEFTSPFMGGFAVMADGDVDFNGGIEIGVSYFPQYFSIYRDGREHIERGGRFYITMGYRHWFTPRFSMAGAFFSSYAFGDPVEVQNDFGGSPPLTSAHDMTEYGADVSAQWEFWHWQRFSLLFDGRYSYALTAKSGEDENFVAFLFMVKYFFQGKEGTKE